MDLLIAKAEKYLPEESLNVIAKAYRFAENAHAGQFRLSGELFIEHPLQTACFLADMRLDANALAAALLHDVIEDCDVLREEIQDKFGDDVARLVDGVTKLTRTDLMPDGHATATQLPHEDAFNEAENLRKMLLSMAEDVRVVLIKLADRLHNMKTLDPLPPNKRLEISTETLEIYAPIAHRLGIWELKWRLEDLAFQHLNRQAYKEIADLLTSKRSEREAYVERAKNQLQKELKNTGIMSEVMGRPKNIYSIHKKIQDYATQNKEVAEIYDLFALRILVDGVQDCYAALGIVHRLWHPIPGQFDDYIANPKDNLYQSLHTTVICEQALPVEIQIRTHDMHRGSEYGVAAHWLYKEGIDVDPQFEAKMTWLRQLLDWQRAEGGPEEFVESFKTDVFKSQVFVYTPKGDLKELPAGATVLDFAYRIHTDIGHQSIGAKVNDKLVPLHYQLKNGDTVHILTSKTTRGPSLDWLNRDSEYLNTTSARARVRQWFNHQERKTNLQRGMEMFQKQVRLLDMSIDDLEVANIMGLDTTAQFFTSLGGGTITVSQVVEALSSHMVMPQNEVSNHSQLMGPASGAQVLGVGELPTRMAHCCSPIQGNQIIGVVARDNTVTVHLKTCQQALSEADTGRLTGVTWGKVKTLYPVRIRVEAWDRVGLLGDITSLVSKEHVNIASCKTDEFDDISVISLTVYIVGIDQLYRLCSRLEGTKGVINVSRTES